MPEVKFILLKSSGLHMCRMIFWFRYYSHHDIEINPTDRHKTSFCLNKENWDVAIFIDKELSCTDQVTVIALNQLEEGKKGAAHKELEAMLWVLKMFRCHWKTLFIWNSLSGIAVANFGVFISAWCGNMDVPNASICTSCNILYVFNTSASR